MVIHFSVRHDAPALQRRILSYPPRLDSAMRDATKEATEVLRKGTISTVQNRTNMSAEVAARITEADFRPTPGGGRGTVGFTKPPARFYPRTKKALAFTIGGRRIVRRSVKGSRPYKLLNDAGIAQEEAVKERYRGRVGRVLG